MKMRTVHSKTRFDKNTVSNLDPKLMRQWDVEYLQPTVEYPDYDNFVQRPGEDTWKCIFTFDFEKQDLDDFKPQVNVTVRPVVTVSFNKCHTMHHDEDQICKKLSLISWNNTVEYKESG